MSSLSLTETKAQGQSPQPQRDAITAETNPSLQHLLDVISSIIAGEYIAIAKQNPAVFQNTTPRLSDLRGYALSGQGGKK